MLIEPILIEYLGSKVDVEIYPTIPAEHSEMFATIQKTDSEIRNHIEGATFEICSYAHTKYEAMVLDDLIKTALLGDGSTSYGIVEKVEISSCTYGGGNDAPNTTTKSYRYRSYYNFVY